MRHNNRTLLTPSILLAAGLLAACDGTAATPEMPTAGHPASASAPAAAMPAASDTLLVTPAGEPAAPPPREVEHAHVGGLHPQHPAATQPATQPSTQPATQAAAMYVCPMHPEVTSTDPDARCPKCGMFLEPVKAEQPAQ